MHFNRLSNSGLFGGVWLIWEPRSFCPTSWSQSRCALPTSDCDSERGTWSIALMEHYSCLAILCNAAATLLVTVVDREWAYTPALIQSHSHALHMCRHQLQMWRGLCGRLHVFTDGRKHSTGCSHSLSIDTCHLKPPFWNQEFQCSVCE